MYEYSTVSSFSHPPSYAAEVRRRSMHYENLRNIQKPPRSKKLITRAVQNYGTISDSQLPPQIIANGTSANTYALYGMRF